MKLSLGMAKPCSFMQQQHGSKMSVCMADVSEQSMKPNSDLKIKSSFNKKIGIDSKKKFEKIRGGNKLSDKWMECQGIKNWEGLLDPLDDDLRHEILRYGEFVEAAYGCFDFDTSSPTYSTCRYPIDSMLGRCGVRGTGYKVTRSLHATSSVSVAPSCWIEKLPNWVSNRSNWIGYVAVCDDKDEIARLGRRDVVIAYRGTAMCTEWLENLRATLTCLPDDMAPKGCDQPMVQKGFLSLYTSCSENQVSLQDSIREEISTLLQKYIDEPLSVTVTGHSLGSALATLTAYDISNTFKHAPLVTVVSFGGPRVGNKAFCSQLEENGAKVLRIVNSDDLITKVPGFFIENDDVEKGDVHVAGMLPSWIQKKVWDTQWMYAEVGEELRLSSRDCPHVNKRDVATCHDLKTYLHLVNNFVSSTCPFRATAKRVLGKTHHQENHILVR